MTINKFVCSAKRSAGKTCGNVAYKVLVMNKSIARIVVLCEKISNR